jgi:non-ribosomal peptide synthetase component F
MGSGPVAAGGVMILKPQTVFGTQANSAIEIGLLGCGGRIHIVSDGERKDAGHLARMLCSEPITFWDSAPAALQLVAPALRAQPGPVKNMKLRQVFLSGDWIPVALPDEVRKAFPGAQVMSRCSCPSTWASSAG